MTDRWPEFAKAALQGLCVGTELKRDYTPNHKRAMDFICGAADALDAEYEKRLGSPPADEFERQMDRLVAANESDIRREERERVLAAVKGWFDFHGATQYGAWFAIDCANGRFDPPEEK